jgi:hypothetical protein
VADEAARLKALGISIVDDDVAPAVRAECSRIARGLDGVGVKIVGLLPATADVAVPGLAVQLGRAMVDLTGATVAVIDANVYWPALAKLSGEQEADGFATHWLRGSLALLTPSRAGVAGAGLPELRRAIAEGRELFAHIVVDLTGFDRLGEHLAAAELVQGVVIVARAGRTTERELLRWNEELPENLGVLLLG